MIGCDWEVERQRPDSSNRDTGNGTGKIDQCEIKINGRNII